MNLALIRLRSSNCAKIQSLGLTWKIVSCCDEETMQSCLCFLQDTNFYPYLQKVNSKTQQQAFQSLGALQYMLDILKRDVAPPRLDSLLEQIELADLMERYEASDVEKVLNDSLINSRYLITYLKYYYYYSDGLEDDKKIVLMEGLDNFYNKQSNLGEAWIAQYGAFLTDNVMVSDLLFEIEDYDSVLIWYATDDCYHSLLSLIAQKVRGNIRLDDENAQELFKYRQEIQGLLISVEKYFDNIQLIEFYKLWLHNHALIQDLRKIKKRIEQSPDINVENFLAGRAFYVAFCYNICLPKALRSDQEELIIYAVTHKKRAFLRLISENVLLFENLSTSCVLFNKSFYAKCINLNSINLNNLNACAHMQNYSPKMLEALARREHTFGELEVFYKVPLRYASLYEKLSVERVDDRLRIIRELIKRKCISENVSLNSVAECLSKKLLSDWMRQDFNHIVGLTSELAIGLLSEYRRLYHLIPQILNAAETRYVLNIEANMDFSSMQELRKAVIKNDKEWNHLVDTFGYTKEFVDENKGRITEFIFNDGAYITAQYLKKHTSKMEDLRRLVTAELLGKFRELKYYGDDLQKEIDFPITDAQRQSWIHNYTEVMESVKAWEADDFISIMQIGEIPHRTCLSYEDGQYSECLIANHDSNKKAIYVAVNDKIVLRASLRFTKGTYHEEGKNNTPSLQFADLTALAPNEDTVPGVDNKEWPVLFLETAYISGLSDSIHNEVINLIIMMLRKKANALGALLVLSARYSNYALDDFVRSNFFMYISKSKAGSQYLDSLGGSNSVANEGSYKKGSFLIDIR